MKRLLPLVFVVASVTLAGCKNQNQPKPAPANNSAGTTPTPQPYTPPADNGMASSSTPAPDAGSEVTPVPQSAGTETHSSTTVHHHAATGHHIKYVVKKGDTLTKIAHAHHVSMKRIEAANPGIDPNKIRVGQSIIIP